MRGRLFALGLIIEEVHVNGVPAESGDPGNTVSSLELIPIFTGKTVTIRFLLLATGQVRHADSLFGEEIGSTEGAKAIGVDLALRVSKLAFSVVVEEIKSIAVDADAGLVEERAMFVSIFTSSLGIDSISLDAGDAGSSIRVVFLAILILDLADSLVVQDIAIPTS